MNVLREYASKENTKEKFPLLNNAIKKLDNFIGADTIKDSIASCTLYHIAEKLSKEPKRRSTRKISKVPTYAEKHLIQSKSKSKSKKSFTIEIDVNSILEKVKNRMRASKNNINEEYAIDDNIETEDDTHAKDIENEDIDEDMDDDEDGDIDEVMDEDEDIEDEYMDADDEDEDEDMDDDEYLPFYEKYLQNIDIHNTKSHFVHTLLLGEPGSGKTTLADILVELWHSIDMIKLDSYIKTTRSDWVGRYQGQSVANAKKLIKKAQNGVIFIDEAYSLISSDNDDQYGIEVLTEIVESMSNPDKNVIFIFAGYENDMRRLFQYNNGLERRFGFVYRLEKPSSTVLVDIFYNQIKRHGWKIRKNQELIDFFKKHNNILKYAGGSTNTLIFNAKQSYITRKIKNDEEIENNIEIIDLENALKDMQKNSTFFQPPSIPHHLYM